MSNKKQISIMIILTLVLITVSGWVSGWVSAYSPDYYLQIQKNIELFGRIYQEIAKNYVEEVDPNTFMRAGIKGMLSTLDPYTVLLEDADNAELQIMSSGKYGGLGMRIGLRGGWPTVVEPPFDGTPSLKAGIREGDRIIAVDSLSTKGLSISRVASLLRGDIGSEVFLKIERQGEEHPIEFRLIRAEIVVTDVAYSRIIKEGVGYIRLSHFSLNAGKDIEKAIRKLKKQGLQSLILDLRSNPGGLLETAVSVSENFLKKGKLIISTQGRFSGASKEYHARKNPILEDSPLVILVNGYSASASEIVAGAIQDHDRGVIIGDNTFGKGLVQTVVRITGKARLKITTAKYLVPSGRSIQDPKKFLKAPDEIIYHGDDEANASLDIGAPVEEKTYYTANGRKVFASHGITPDILIERESLTVYEQQLLRKTMPFQFAVIYATKHPKLKRGFDVTDDMLNEFEAFLKENNFEYVSEAERTLNELEEIAEKNQYYASISAPYNELRRVILDQKNRESEKGRDFIREQLQQEISAKLWGSQAEVEASIDSDPVVLRALTLLSNESEYRALLSGEKDEKQK
ncbi:MAG: S41 family peptidase [bacterium]